MPAGEGAGTGLPGGPLVGVMWRLGLALYKVAARGEAFDPDRLYPGKGERPTATTKATNAGAKTSECAAKTKGAAMN